MRKLAIVVNCTNRKSVIAAPSLSVRTLPQGSVTDRGREWISRVNAAPASCELVDLYNGEAWTQAKLLLQDATRLGFAAQLLVASAGLGLRPVEALAPAYAATFSGGQVDTVATSLDDSRAWWELLRDSPDAVAVDSLRGASVLAVLSESYARVLHSDLNRLSDVAAEMLVIGGAAGALGCPRIPADRALRQTLGGTVSSLNLRMARAWMSMRRSTALHTGNDEQKWQIWSQGVRKVERYDRQQLDDQEVRALIVKLFIEEPAASATQALRHLRSTGFACEQKRFHRIHAQLVKELL
ncbi:hypothetical protein [Gordonia rubripertincta]|uniref:Uncharacterized protein n=1 Tax=Gordonia rubripertincta TaxID=36822 RepID=A0ABT4N2S5_GORRU|nr:hypothetical protein [Gordonia rubripertincta]MCZ4552232.1 hypothetical protein [Gordonia rubripertincta]